jgi:hypothetical protein
MRRRAELTGHDNHWVGLDVAAAALNTSIGNARVLAHRDHWRRTPTKPRGYLMADIRATAQRRKDRTS